MQLVINIIIVIILAIRTESVMKTLPFPKILTDKEKQRQLSFHKNIIVLCCAYLAFSTYLYTILKDQVTPNPAMIIIAISLSVSIFFALLGTIAKGGPGEIKSILDDGLLRGATLGLTRGALIGIIPTIISSDISWIFLFLFLGMFFGLIQGWLMEFHNHPNQGINQNNESSSIETDEDF